MANAEKQFQEALVELRKTKIEEEVRKKIESQLQKKIEEIRTKVLEEYWNQPENIRKRYREMGASLYDEIYDIDLKEAIKPLLESPHFDNDFKIAVSETYWYIGHALADGRYESAALTAEGLVGLKVKDPNIEKKIKFIEEKVAKGEKLNFSEEIFRQRIIVPHKVGEWAEKFIEALKKKGKIEK